MPQGLKPHSFLGLFTRRSKRRSSTFAAVSFYPQRLLAERNFNLTNASLSRVQLFVAEAVDHVVVDHSHGLHEGIADG